MPSVLWKLLLVWLLVALGTACDDKAELTKTQLTLRVSLAGTDLDTRITRLKLRVYHASSRGWLLSSQVSVDAGRVRWPLDVPILPGPVDPSLQRIEVIIDGYARDELLAQARVLSGFEPGALRVLPLGLYLCASGVCANESCHGPACLSCGASGSCEVVTTVDARALPTYDPAQTPSDEEAGGAGPDSSTDAAVGVDASPPLDAASTSPPACAMG